MPDGLNNPAGVAGVLAFLGLLVKTAYDLWTARIKDAADKRRIESEAKQVAERRANEGKEEVRNLLREQLERLERDIQAYKVEVVGLRLELDVTQKRYGQLQVDYEGQRRELDGLRREHAALKDAHVDVLNQLDTLRLRVSNNGG